MYKTARLLFWVFLGIFYIALLHVEAALTAQRIPAPEEILGFKVGSDYHLASYQDALKYLRAVEQASPMIKLMEIGTTSMGKPMICAVITSAENMKRLDALREISRKLALADSLDDAAARRLAAEGRAIVYIDGGLHATEVAPAQHNLQLAYDLLTSDDPDTRLIRDNTILLLNFPNPDGMDMVAEWYRKNVGTPFEISSLPRLYHLYAGHDNNRDSYMLNLKESQAIHNLEFRVWYPLILINHHQTAPFPTRISIPPLPEPLNPNIHPLVTRWKNLLGSAVGVALDRNGQPGGVSRIVIDGWAPEMVDSVGDLFGTISTSPETALYRYATPHDYTVDEFPEEYRDFMPSIFYPSPWKGGWWRLKDAVDYVLTFSKSTLHTAAVYREALLFDRYRMARDTITRFQKEPPYAWVIPQNQWDPPVAALMLQRMTMMGIEISKADSDFSLAGTTFPAGTWVIPMQQPFAAYVKSMFEEQKYPDLSEHPSAWQGIVRPQKFAGAYIPPYDTAGWTLPYQMGVSVVCADEPLKVALSSIDKVASPAGAVVGGAAYAYLLSAQNNNSFIAVNRILKTGGRVLRARQAFSVAAQSFPPGTWIVVADSVSRSSMNSVASDLSIKIDGIASQIVGDAPQVKAPRIALYQSWVAGADEGWTRWLFEQYEFPFTVLHDDEVKAGGLGKTFDVLVIPDQSTDAIVNGHKAGTMPPSYVGGITSDGVRNIKTFVEEGGTLVLLNASSSFAMDHLGVPLTDALKQVRAARRGSGFSGQAPDAQRAPFACPGSVLKMEFDPKHPVAYGMPEQGAASFSNNSIAFDINPGSQTAVGIVARYPAGNLLLSGFLRGGNYLNNKVSAAETRLGKGKVILLGFPVQKRAQPHGTFKLLFNSLYYGSTQ